LEDDEVITEPLTPAQALTRLREAGVTKAASIAELGRSWGWKRERTSKALVRWQGAGHIVREQRPDGIMIRVPGLVPADVGDVPAGTPAIPAGCTARDDIPASEPGGLPAAPILEAAVVPALHVERPVWRNVPQPEQPVERHRSIARWTMFSALGMASVSAGFSIYGFTVIFGGYFWPIITMGGFLESCKLSGAAWLGLGYGPRWLRGVVAVLVAVLMGLNAVGDYGFLVRAHVGHGVEGHVAVAARLADIDGRIALQTIVVANIDRQLGQIDGSIEKAMAAGKVNGAMALAGDQRHTRTQLQVERMAAGKNLAELKVERARIEGERRIVEADLGPVRYLAALIGAEDETVMRWFILTVALLLDPAAVLLLLAAATRRPHD
jgi:hypothetical protein